MGYGKRDSRRDTRSSRKEQNQAWHDARDHAAGSGQLKERNRNKVRDSSSGGIIDTFMEIIGFKDDYKKKKNLRLPKNCYW